MASAPVTVLSDRIAPMQWSVIEEALAQCGHVSVVAKDVPTEQLQDAIDRLSPEVLILGASETLRQVDQFETWLREAAPKRRIIVLQGGLRLIQLREWRLSVDSLDGASIELLSAAIEGRC